METSRVVGKAVIMSDDKTHREIVTAHLAIWLTKCLQDKMTLQHFKKIWRRFWKEDEEGLTEPGEVPGYTPLDQVYIKNHREFDPKDKDIMFKIELERGAYWGDVFRGCHLELEGGKDLTLTRLYGLAVREKADKFVSVTEDEAAYIVAACGNPGADALYKAVRPQYAQHWPDEFGPGTPIAQLHQRVFSWGEVVLEDGSWIHFDEYPIKDTKGKRLVKIFRGQGETPTSQEGWDKTLIRQYEIEVQEDESE